jgi:hypothetical protein
MAASGTGMQGSLALKLDLSTLAVHGHLEMAQKGHTKQPHGHVAFDVDGHVDVADLSSIQLYISQAFSAEMMEANPASSAQSEIHLRGLAKTCGLACIIGLFLSSYPLVGGRATMA